MLELATVLLPLLAFQLSPMLLPAAVSAVGYVSDRRGERREIALDARHLPLESATPELGLES